MRLSRTVTLSADPDVDSDPSAFTLGSALSVIFSAFHGWQTGPVFCIYREGARITRAPIRPKADNQGKRSRMSFQPRKTAVALVNRGYGERQKVSIRFPAKGREEIGDRTLRPSEAHQRLEAARFIGGYSGKPAREPNRYAFCQGWKLLPAHLCSHTPWLYAVNLSRMETRAGRKKSYWSRLLE